MVNVAKLKSRMVLAGHNQRSLVAELRSRGIQISENTFSAKMTGRSDFNVEDALVICEILGIENPEDKADIFLA
jgi:hypothetical protein